MEEKTLPPVPTPCRKVSSSRQFAIATHPISPPEPHLSRPSKAPPRIAYGDRCPRPVHQGELVRRLNEEEALTILRPSMGHPAVPRILGDARCLYGSQVANHTMFDYDNLKAYTRCNIVFSGRNSRFEKLAITTIPVTQIEWRMKRPSERRFS
uniref:Uncharacterized protein n=1 Tax=Oryza glumipatula TaxID=40148 RepID=A0A0D9Y4Y8_9ORYZ